MFELGIEFAGSASGRIRLSYICSRRDCLVQAGLCQVGSGVRFIARWALLLFMLPTAAMAVAPGIAITAKVGEGRIIRSLADGDALPSGAGISFTLGTREARYIYLIAKGSSGKAQVIHPYDRDSSKARFAAGEVLRVPTSPNFLTLRGRTGSETIVALSRTKRVRNWGSLLRIIERSPTPQEMQSKLAEAGFDAAVISFLHLSPERYSTWLPRLNLGGEEESGVLSDVGKRIPNVRLRRQ